MDASEIKLFLDAEPFHAFTIATSRTGSHTVTDPSRVFLTRKTVYIGTDIAGDGIAESHVEIPTKQIIRIEARR